MILRNDQFYPIWYHERRFCLDVKNY